MRGTERSTMRSMLYRELSGLFDPGKNTVMARILELKSENK